MIIGTEIASSEVEVFNKENSAICTCPVANETKEVGERGIESVSTDDGEWECTTEGHKEKG